MSEGNLRWDGTEFRCTLAPVRTFCFVAVQVGVAWTTGGSCYSRSKARTVFERWDRGFESHSRHGCLCVRLFSVYVVLCLGSGLATG
jgi:hypothetical protein